MSDAIGEYKFLDSKDIDRILRDGTFRLGSLSYFRNMEGAEWVADRLEGTSQVIADGAVVASSSATPVGESWAPAGHPPLVRAQTGAVIQFGEGMRFSYRHAEVYIFCASQGELTTLSDAMCRNSVRPYNACVRFKVSLHLLAHRLYHHGSIVELGGRPLRGIFGPPTTAKVTYETVTRNFREGRAPAPSPFRKEQRFESQSEVRIVFTPHSASELGQIAAYPHITAKLPRPDRSVEAHESPHF